MDKIYCKKCEYMCLGLYGLSSDYGYYCSNKQTYKDTPIQPISVSCFDLNENNDCIYFKNRTK